MDLGGGGWAGSEAVASRDLGSGGVGGKGGRKLGQGVGTSLQILELQDMLRPSTVPGTQDIT